MVGTITIVFLMLLVSFARFFLGSVKNLKKSCAAVMGNFSHLYCVFKNFGDWKLKGFLRMIYGQCDVTIRVYIAFYLCVKAL